MPSINDFWNKTAEISNKLTDVKTEVQGVHAATDAVRSAVHDVDTTLKSLLGQLITLETYVTQALAHNARQNDTMICILEHISQNTCALLNQATIQTSLQRTIADGVSALADTYAIANPAAAAERQRNEALRKQIEACCPPEQPAPPCRYERCPAPEPLGDPPRVDDRPNIG